MGSCLASVKTSGRISDAPILLNGAHVLFLSTNASALVTETPGLVLRERWQAEDLWPERAESWGNLSLSSGIIEAEVQVDVSKSSLAARV